MNSRRPRRLLRAGIAIVFAAFAAASSPAQESALATVGDSATAWQWFQQMEDQARENPAEAARLAQRLLDGYERKLVPAGGEADRDLFVGVRERVQRFLLPRPAVLERYRAFESAEAERALAAGDLRETAALRALTPAGLRANLILAEREVRAGRFAAAASRLSELEGHPDLRGEESAAYWFLRSAAARLRGEPDAAREAAARVVDLEAASWIEAVAKIDRIEPATAARRSEASGFGDWQQVWREELPGAPFARTFLAPGPMSASDPLAIPAAVPRVAGSRTRDESAWMVLWPVIHGESVLVNDGMRVRAIDRFSRRERWSGFLADRGAFEPERGPPGDLLGIGVGDRTVVAYGIPGPGLAGTGGGTVAAFDAESGVPRWKVALSALGGEEFDRLVPMGFPVVGDGQAVVLARRVTPRLETVEYLLSLDLADGSLRWSSFLCSSGGIRPLNGRPSATPALADGSILVASAGGGVGRVDPSDGRIRWYRRFLVPIRDLRITAEPWELGGPVVVGESVFAIVPDQSEVVQLDLGTGRTVASFPLGVSATWGSPRCLLGDGRRIYSIGADLRAIDAATPDRLLWSFAEANAELVRELPGSASRSGIRGRVSSVGEHLLVPTLDRVLFVSAATGRVERSVAIDFPGNPVLDDRSDAPQLLVAGVAALSCLMPAEAAERAMRARIAARPDDPQSALALLDLAVRGDRLELVLESARLAASAVDRRGDEALAEDDRDELLRLLLAAAGSRGPGAAEVEPIHTLAREIARSPRQSARQRLAGAEWLLARSRAADAVATLRPLVEDRAFAAVILEPEPGRSVPASAVALDLLQTIPPDALAAIDAANPVPLPGTRRGVDASLAAAEAASAPAESLRILGEAWRSLSAEPPESGEARRVVEAIRALAVRQGWSGLIADVDPAAAPAVTAIDGPIREAHEFPGRIPRRGESEARDRPDDGFLIVEDRSLAFRAGPDLEVRWRRPLDDRNPLVLAWTPEAVLLWEDSTERGERASLIRRDDGTTIAQTPAARDLLPVASLLNAGRPVGQEMPNAQPYLPADTLPLVQGDRLVVVRRSGDVAAFRLATLERPDWVVSDRLDQVYAVDLADWGLLLAGQARSPDRPEGIPTMLVLDPATGNELSRTELPDGVRWARLGLFGEAVAGTATGIHAVDAVGGEPLWSLTGLSGQDTIGAIRIGPRLLVRDAVEGLSGVNLRDGSGDPAAFRMRPSGSVGGPVVAEIPVPGATIVHREQRVQLFSPDGRGLGEDAIADDRDFTFVVPVQGGVLALNALGARQVPLPDRTGSRTEFPYLLYLLETGSGLRLAADPVEIRVPGQRVDRSLALEGALVLSSGSSTAVLPIPFRGPSAAVPAGEPRPSSR